MDTHKTAYFSQNALTDTDEIQIRYKRFKIRNEAVWTIGVFQYLPKSTQAGEEMFCFHNSEKKR